MTLGQLSQLIDHENDKIVRAQYFYQKVDAQNSILQIKIHSGDSTLSDEIYVDLKYLIIFYLKSIEEKQHGYDEIDLNKIFFYAKHLPFDQRVKILTFLHRLLALNGFEDETESCAKELINANCELFLNDKSIVSKLRWFYLKTTKNLVAIILTLTVFYGICYILLLPTDNPQMQLFEVEYLKLSDNFYQNHGANILAGLFQISDEFKIKPLNTFGIIMLVIGKLMFLIIVINILIKEISNKLKL
ncbi:hypothetical protein [Pontibacter lucknowensis]|uniref:Uncharacterized protein n=1 Tax=Pontibacter lucknowensis TaxID=1077936 RepID=A0A1N6W2E3_9BACT|nr:hypothetical protein [Pontibacter lucknowensis]SIQ84162.1 hypothetical protein SAMN05421545_1321 [Pontibacter lucknowensis]